MTHPALIERITRSLAYMLRHQPDEFDLEVDEHGYAEIGEVLRALNERLGESVSEEDVREAVESGDRQRYEIADDRIRALYGHSIEVQPGEPTRPPERLYVGVSRADADRARRYGLRPGRRRFLHLALTPDDALETAQRTAREHEVIVVSAMDAWEAGINFYDRISLFLSDPIPTQFLEGAVPQGHRGVASGRPAPIRHAREEVVYARPEDDDAHAHHDEEAADDAPAEFAPATEGHAPAGDDGPRRRRRGRRGAEGAPAEPARSDERAAPVRNDYEDAPRAREEFRPAPPARPEPRRDDRGPRTGAPGGGFAPGRGDGGRGPDRGPDRSREERPAERRAPERAHPAERGFQPDRGAPRSDDRGPRDERPRAPERPYDDRPRGPERAREERPRQEERPRFEDRPRDDRPRFEERPRDDRGERPQGRPEGRPERAPRPMDEGRPAARRDEIPRPQYEAPRRQEPEGGGGFGGGLEDSGRARPAPQRPAPPPPRPAPRVEERKPERPAPADDGGFGAGIL